MHVACCRRRHAIVHASDIISVVVKSLVIIITLNSYVVLTLVVKSLVVVIVTVNTYHGMIFLWL